MADTVVFHDTFTQAVSDHVNINTLTPDVAGTDYSTFLFNSSGGWAEIDIAGDFIEPDGVRSNAGLIYKLNYGTVNEADIDFEVNYKTIGDRAAFQTVHWMVARWADADNFIALRVTRDATIKAELWKVVSGTSTKLGTSTSTPADGDVVKLELRGSVWRVFFDSGSGYGSAEISVTEADLSAKGPTGFGWGEPHATLFAGEDGRPIAELQINSIKVTEIGAVTGVTVTPSLATAVSGNINPSVVLGGMIISPVVTSTLPTKIDPVVELGNIGFNPVPAIGIPGKNDPSVDLGSLIISPNFIQALSGRVAPGIVLSSLNIIPDPASAITAKLDPNVIGGGDVFVSPISGLSIPSKLDPNIIFGNIFISPSVASGVPLKADPSVIQSDIFITPGFSSVLTEKVDPAIILGGLSVSPVFGGVIVDGVDPATVFGNLNFIPSPGFVVADKLDPAVFLGIVVDQGEAKLVVSHALLNKIQITETLSTRIKITEEVL